MRGGLRSAAAAVAVDVALIIAFALLGRLSHEEGATPGGVLWVAAPFLTGWLAGSAVARLDRAPFSVRRAAVAWALGLPLAFAIRTVVGDGLAVAFVVVALTFTGATLIGWRGAAALARRSRPAS